MGATREIATLVLRIHFSEYFLHSAIAYDIWFTMGISGVIYLLPGNAPIASYKQTLTASDTTSLITA
jgi:beta-lactamase regulating signal transducer with metallopeptidase domain